MNEKERLCKGSNDYDTLRGDITAGNGSNNTRRHYSRKLTDVYRERWCVLIVYCFLAIFQGIVIGTYGPVQQYLKTSVGWTVEKTSFVNMLLWLTLAVASPFCIWMILKRGEHLLKTIFHPFLPRIMWEVTFRPRSF